MRVYQKGLEYNSISVINSLVSTTLFISYTFGMLLLRPILEARFSRVKLNWKSFCFTWQKRCNLNWKILPKFLISVTLNSNLEITHFLFYKKPSKSLVAFFLSSFILLVETQYAKTYRLR